MYSEVRPVVWTEVEWRYQTVNKKITKVTKQTAWFMIKLQSKKYQQNCSEKREPMECHLIYWDSALKTKPIQWTKCICNYMFLQLIKLSCLLAQRGGLHVWSSVVGKIILSRIKKTPPHCVHIRHLYHSTGYQTLATKLTCQRTGRTTKTFDVDHREDLNFKSARCIHRSMCLFYKADMLTLLFISPLFLGIPLTCWLMTYVSSQLWSSTNWQT